MKAETARLDQLEIDDFEVTLLKSFLFSNRLLLEINIRCEILQMDEEERYNRKLDSGLYTLQVGN